MATQVASEEEEDEQATLATTQVATQLATREEDEQATLAQFGCARHQLLQKLGDACREAGQRAQAAEAYQEASEAAMEVGKTKVSMKLAALAEEMGEEEEEDDEEAS